MKKLKFIKVVTKHTYLIDPIISYNFHCPHCNHVYTIAYTFGEDANYKKVKHYYVQSKTYDSDGEWIEPQCELFHHLHTSDDWNIRSLNKFKHRLSQFYMTNEYKTILKQEILRNL